MVLKCMIFFDRTFSGWTVCWIVGCIGYMICPPLKKEGHIALHMLVGMLVGTV